MRIRTAIFLSSNFLKLAALLIAYFLWSMLSDLYVIQGTYTVPVNIQKTNNLEIKEAPNQAIITLAGHRKNLRKIDRSKLAICINGKCLTSGSNIIRITNEHLSLPASINIVDYSPINFTVTTTEIQNTSSSITTPVTNESPSSTSA